MNSEKIEKITDDPTEEDPRTNIDWTIFQKICRNQSVLFKLSVWRAKNIPFDGDITDEFGYFEGLKGEGGVGIQLDNINLTLP